MRPSCLCLLRAWVTCHVPPHLKHGFSKMWGLVYCKESQSGAGKVVQRIGVCYQPDGLHSVPRPEDQPLQDVLRPPHRSCSMDPHTYILKRRLYVWQNYANLNCHLDQLPFNTGQQHGQKPLQGLIQLLTSHQMQVLLHTVDYILLLSFPKSRKIKPDVVSQTCNPSTWKEDQG